jgi:hypothetical protein
MSSGSGPTLSAWAISQPARVDVDEILLRRSAQDG